MNHLLTQERLKEILHYEPTTGCFKWLRAKRKYCGSKEHNGYITIQINRKKYKAHRLAWLYTHGYMPNGFIDHINGVRNDNRLCNLREATNQENQRNSLIRKDNTSGFKGVSFHKSTGKWAANIRLNNKLKHLGLFESPELAFIKYDEAAKSNFGKFFKDSY